MSKIVDTKFFSVPTHPINLAVFRIVFAITLFFQISWSKTLFYAGLPDILLYPTEGLGWLVPYLPITPESVVTVGYFYYAACFFLLIGLF